jgi:hypothetical protein
MVRNKARESNNMVSVEESAGRGFDDRLLPSALQSEQLSQCDFELPTFSAKWLL